MAAPVYDVADYAAAMHALMPTGRAWPRHPDSVQGRVVSALAPTYARSHLAANGLLANTLPSQTAMLLPEWERTLGLPDRCSGPGATLTQRRAQVHARFIAQGGQSRRFFIDYAAALGVRIEIEEFAPSRAGHLRADQPAYGTAWAHAWRVLAPVTIQEFFRAGRSAADERLSTFGNGLLECELRRVAPAHTALLFAYTLDPNAGRLTPGQPAALDGRSFAFGVNTFA